MIRAIVNQDRRERHAAGFKLGSNFLAHRIAKAFGLKLETVRKIKEGKRRRHVKASRLIQATYTREPEQLEEIRQRRIRSGAIGASWRGVPRGRCYGSLSYKQALRAAMAEAEGQDRSHPPRRRSRSPKRP